MTVQLASFSVSNSLNTGFTNVIGYLPTLIGALLVLVIGFFVARVVKAIVDRTLHKVGFDRKLTEGEAGRYITPISPQGEPSRLVGGLVFWAIFVFVLSSAIGNLRIAALTKFMNTVLHYLPDVIAAALILIIGAALAGGIAAAVHRLMGDTPTGRIVRAVAPALIMSIAVFMALVQLRIALQIVELTYAALMFALSLGSALAFGLGGREVAASILTNAYQNTDMDRIRADVRTGQSRAQAQAEQARKKTQEGDPDVQRGGPAARRRDRP